jgi:hypothetical protein
MGDRSCALSTIRSTPFSTDSIIGNEVSTLDRRPPSMMPMGTLHSSLRPTRLKVDRVMLIFGPPDVRYDKVVYGAEPAIRGSLMGSDGPIPGECSKRRPRGRSPCSDTQLCSPCDDHILFESW